jgi:hypothetical protein
LFLRTYFVVSRLNVVETKGTGYVRRYAALLFSILEEIYTGPKKRGSSLILNDSIYYETRLRLSFSEPCGDQYAQQNSAN